MGVFDDDEIRRSPADCLLLLYTHLWRGWTLHARNTHWSSEATCTRPPPPHPFLIVEELLAL